jgi:hypothetical protein
MYTRSLRIAALATPIALLAAPGPIEAQSEAVLKKSFEGTMVVAKLDMPATDDGVDLYPGREQVMNFKSYSDRVKRYGVAIRKGDTVMVTTVRVKAKNIEFQLAGGGYGTFGDETSNSVYIPSASKTKRESNLERDIKKDTDPKKKKEMQEELDDLRKSREREDARNRASAAEAEQFKREEIARKRVSGGSCFNLWFDPEVPSSAVSPDAVRDLLAQYVDFPSPGTTATPAGTPATPGASITTLRKGLSRAEVDALLGRPLQVDSKAEGGLTVQTASYLTEELSVTADFVQGALVRFTIRSR